MPPKSASHSRLLRLNQVDAAYGGRPPVLRGLCLEIAAGGHLAVTGPNGCGKSTLLRLLQGELRPVQLPGGASAGSVAWFFAGHEERSPLAAREHARLVSPRQQRLWVRKRPGLDGESVLLSGLDNSDLFYGRATDAQRGQARKLVRSLDREPGADERAAQLLALKVGAMSQGQMRLALILRALMGRPRLLLLDEPFDGLDSPARAAVFKALELAAGQGATLVLSAHREEDIPPFITKRLRLEKGRIAPGDQLKTEATICSARHPAPADQARRLCPADQSPCLAGSQAPLQTRPPAPAGNAPPLLELRQVDVFIEGRKTLHDINWIVRDKERWLISGPNGAGKSALLRLVYGDEFAAFGGHYLWRGQPRPGLAELRAETGLVSDRLQDGYAYDLCALEMVISGLRGSIGLYAAADENEEDLAMAWLEHFGAGHLAASPFFDLSSGNARRVLLARALAAAPQTLLLDEPCSGLDAQGRDMFFKALRALIKKGVTLLYVSHRAEDARSLFTHELRLEKGRVITAGPLNPA
ncbi:ATP-binding cassette domain-containing protein [Desulfovibrio sp. OttesenSCG-928-G11]|nr:ATP-binding cassette domain-containing protein [Desulfovibrio sp. OttesenSCG-928-G11]